MCDSRHDYASVLRDGGVSAESDAKGIGSFLKGQGFHVTPLYNKQATRKRIVAEMEDTLAPKLKDGDRVLIFFAGHGHTRTLGGVDVGYIIPYDGDESSGSYISMDTLRSESRNMRKATHQLFIMDACYSGLLTRSGALELDANDFPDSPSYIKALIRRPSRLILTAGGKGQRVRDGGPGGHSFFSYSLLEALQKSLADLNEDGYITFSELTTYMEPRASAWNQTPGYGALDEHGLGSFIFRSQGGTGLSEQAKKPSSTPLGKTRAGEAEFAVPGTRGVPVTINARVVRGPDWKWGDQGGNTTGVVIRKGFAEGWWVVHWDNGDKNKYRWGAEGKYEIRVVQPKD
jgi:hypothetical protein